MYIIMNGLQITFRRCTIIHTEFYLALIKCAKRVPNNDKLEIPYSVYFLSRFEYFAQSSAQIVSVPESYALVAETLPAELPLEEMQLRQKLSIKSVPQLEVEKVCSTKTR
jgi:hypothetical protein